MKRSAGLVLSISAVLLLGAITPGAAVEPHRSFERLVTSNGHAVVSYDRATARIDTFLEHPFRFLEPANDPPDLCFAADESRNLAFDTYFGVRSVPASGVRGDWLAEAPLDDAGYVIGTGIIYTDQHVGEARTLRTRTWSFMPMGLEQPALIMVARVDNVGPISVPVSVYSLFNFHLGDAGGGRVPSADGEEVSWDPTRATFYEYGPSAGTMAYVSLAGLIHRTVTVGAASAYNSLAAGADLDDVSATSGPTTDVAPGFQGPETSLAPGASAWFAVGILWALDEDAAPDVDALTTWAAGRTPDALVADEEAEWAAWHTPVPAGFTPEEEALWLHANAILRMGQVREAGPGFGQILASLPPGRGDISAQWNIAWVRDMAYATVALARAGHLDEARDALIFQLTAGPGRHESEVGMPYRLSITRYFGNGAEESDCNADGPNIEFDGFGLFLWSLGEWVRAGGDVEEIRPHFPTMRDEIVDVLVSLIESDGTIRADSSIWEVHWNGRERRFTYTSLAAARGLCDAAFIAEALGETVDADRWRADGERVRDAVVLLHTDIRGALAQSREDLLMGFGYVDAASTEAINWGVIDPAGGVADATLDAILENLTVATGIGLMRNDDGGWYDSQEWVFVDLRIVPALRAAGRDARADDIMAWVSDNVLLNDLQFSELHGAATGDYEGSIPMVGFGAGTWLIARDGELAPPACGAFATEPKLPTGSDGGVGSDGGTGACDGAVGAECGEVGGGGCGCAIVGAGSGSSGAPFVALLVLGMMLLRRHVPWRLVRRGSVAGVTLLASAVLSFGCVKIPGSDAGTDAAVYTGPCTAELTYRETSATPRVFVAGSWNGFSESADELLDDGTGTYRITLELDPGLYPYKLVVQGDGAEPWRLDPDNAYRAYDSGLENSGLRVANCRVGAVVVESAVTSRPGPGDGRLDAMLRYERRSAAALGPVVAEVRTGSNMRPLDPSELTVAGDAIEVHLAGLPDGKHVVTVRATDAAGIEAEDAVLPLWIEADPFQWQDAVVYMVVTDRFRNGEATNDMSSPGASAGADWVGGDLEGVLAAMQEGYFDDLGINAMWLTPFNVNPAGTYADADEFHEVAGYHGYWPVEPLDVDDRIGGSDALDAVIAEAHTRGIRILMDLVVNHVHEDHPYVSEHPTWFNSGCVCGTAGCDWTERRLDCLFRPYLPDVNWTNNDAGEQMIADALVWMERYDLDGFRVDAVKHVDDGAIFNLSTRVRERFETAGTRVFLMGETAMGWDSSAGPTEGSNPENYGTISRYIGPSGLDGQFDFVLYYAASLSFMTDQPGRGMPHVDFWTKASLEHYPDGAIMTPYIGSHDTSRYMSLTAHPSLAGNKWDNLPPQPDWDEPYDRMYVALAWLFSVPGAPLLYYGDEYGEYGGADPDNRHLARFGTALSPRENALFDKVKALGTARSDLAGLRRGGYRTVYLTDSFSVVARGEGDDLVLAVLNRSASPATELVPIPVDVAAEGRVFTDALGSGTVVSVSQAAINVTLPPWSALYLN